MSKSPPSSFIHFFMQGLISVFGIPGLSSALKSGVPEPQLSTYIAKSPVSSSSLWRILFITSQILLTLFFFIFTSWRQKYGRRGSNRQSYQFAVPRKAWVCNAKSQLVNYFGKLANSSTCTSNWGNDCPRHFDLLFTFIFSLFVAPHSSPYSHLTMFLLDRFFNKFLTFGSSMQIAIGYSAFLLI